MGSHIETFEELRDHLLEEKYFVSDSLLENLEELTEFQRGRYRGELDAYQDIIDTLRNILKYGVVGKEMECRVID